MNDMEKIELLEKIEKQHGWVDVIDAYTIIHLFTEEFGIIQTALSVENELTYMLMRLRGDAVLWTDFETKKKLCTKCGEEKFATEFQVNVAMKDGRSSRCKACINGRAKDLQSKKKDEEKKQIKSCFTCKTNKIHDDFRRYYVKGVLKRSKSCKNCEKAINDLIKKRNEL
jgi:hypothetical protein